MNRKNGYYWVKYNSKWIIAYYETHEYGFDSSYSNFVFFGIDFKKHTWGCCDDDFEEINENQIININE